MERQQREIYGVPIAAEPKATSIRVFFMNTTANFTRLPRPQQVLAFLSLIHPVGEDAAREILDGHDVLVDEEENDWLSQLYLIDALDSAFDAALYMLASDYVQPDARRDDSGVIVDVLSDMARARGVRIDWGGNVQAHAFRLRLGMAGLLQAAARSLCSAGYTLWRDMSPPKDRALPYEEYNGWITAARDDAALLALCAALNVPVARIG